MSSGSEASGPPPAGAAVTGTRASDQQRDRTVESLSSALSDGRLGLEDFSQRLEHALSARTVSELEQLTSDLGSPALAARPQAGRTSWVVAVMSSTVRRGRWRLGSRTGVLALMGECVLDLRDAEVDHAACHITAVAVMGSVRVIVPEGIEVDVNGVAIMGSKEVRSGQGPALPGAPVIRVTALAVMAEVVVDTEVKSSEPAVPRGPGGSSWLERSELRHQRHLDRREARRRFRE